MQTELVRPRLMRTAFAVVWNGAVDGARRGLLGCPDVWDDQPRAPKSAPKGERLFYGRSGVRMVSASGKSKWQQRMLAEGRCADCGAEPEVGRLRCRRCLDKAAAHMRLYHERKRAEQRAAAYGIPLSDAEREALCCGMLREAKA